MSSAPALPIENIRTGRIYYGWVTLAIAALAMVATLPGRTQGLGLITLPLLHDLQVNEVSFGRINLWATLIGALFCLPCGRLIDRYGVRIVLAVIVACLGLVLLAMSRVTTLRGLFVAVTLTRGFGQSALSVASLAIVGKWFVSRLPKAMGAYAVLVGIGFIAAFPGVKYAVELAGWRSVWFWMGVTFLGLVVPIAFIWTRDSPEQMGLAADPGNIGEGTGNEPVVSTTFSQAIATPLFWLLALASAAYNFIISGIMLFNEPILKDLGFGSSTFRLLLVIMTFTGLAANFVGGWLAQTWRMERLMALAMLIMAGALAALPSARSAGHVMAYALAMGVSGGIVTVVFFACWGRLFGRDHLGRIQGAAQLLTVVGSALGQDVIAQSKHLTGSYDAFFRATALAAGALGLLCLLVATASPNPASVAH